MNLSDLKTGTELHEPTRCTFEVGPRGGVKEHHIAWEVTNVRTWKRDTERFKVTLHRGLKQWAYIESIDELQSLVPTDQCPATLARKEYESAGK